MLFGEEAGRGGGVWSAGKLSCPYSWIEFRFLDFVARILFFLHAELPASGVYQFLDITYIPFIRDGTYERGFRKY